MRNTYVNGLKNDVNNAKIIPSDLKKKNILDGLIVVILRNVV